MLVSQKERKKVLERSQPQLQMTARDVVGQAGLFLARAREREIKMKIKINRREKRVG